MITLPSQGLSIVIPVYNEAENIMPLLAEIQAILQQQTNYEIIMVDDGSTDDTYSAVLSAQKKIYQVKIIRHQYNYGQSASIVSGVRMASLSWIITLDGDGQNDPRDIKILLDMLQQQSNQEKPILIVGHRQKRHDRWLRRLSSRIANHIRHALLRDHCLDTGCSLKLFKRDDFLKLPHFDHIHRFLPALFIRANGEVLNVPVSHRPRLYGQSKYGVMNRLWIGIIDLLGVMWLLRRPCNPEIIKHV
ncbi:MAG: dolichol-phosphate mannosyltransferase [Gammaproteobacteria bacterium RIFCSPHIGHO2_12_FULL_41_20]|nr:MAG: dolichol-phosphate mannosyltransferase [Gammaproteobacteria bacterium RIFCSPHIGHO2_12_FULL_41_20]